MRFLRRRRVERGPRGGRERRLSRAALVAALLGAFFAGAGCGDHRSPTVPGPDPLPGASDTLADFSLVDVNPHSATAGQAVSPRQVLGRISAWYFGHST
jgi:hypothetical protein